MAILQSLYNAFLEAKYGFDTHMSLINGNTLKCLAVGVTNNFSEMLGIFTHCWTEIQVTKLDTSIENTVEKIF